MGNLRLLQLLILGSDRIYLLEALSYFFFNGLLEFSFLGKMSLEAGGSLCDTAGTESPITHPEDAQTQGVLPFHSIFT